MGDRYGDVYRQLTPTADVKPLSEVIGFARVVVVDEVTRLPDEGLGLEDTQVQAFLGPIETWSLIDGQGDLAIQRVYVELDGTLPEANR